MIQNQQNQLVLKVVDILRVTVYMSQGPWPCNCEGPWFSSKVVSLTWSAWIWDNHVSWGGPNINPGRLWKIIQIMWSGNPCELFIQDYRFGPLTLGLLLLVQSELGQVSAFQEILECNGHRPYSLVCDICVYFIQIVDHCVILAYA